MTDENPRRRSFLLNGSETARRILSKDWSKTSFGRLEDWPQSLLTAVNIALDSCFPAILYWGSDLRAIYNDAYRKLLAPEQDELGCSFPAPFPEAADIFRPIAEKALRGEMSPFVSIPFTLTRHDYPEEAWFDWCCSPLRDEAGAVAGFLVMAVEITGSVLAERRKSFLLQFNDALRELDDPQEILSIAAEMVAKHLRADRTVYAEIDESGEHYTIRSDWHADHLQKLAGTRALAELGTPVVEALQSGEGSRFQDLPQHLALLHDSSLAAAEQLEIGGAMALPVVRSDRLAAILLILQTTPRRWTDDEFAIAQGAAARAWAAVERAKAEADLRESEERHRLLEEAWRRSEQAFRAMFESSAAGVAQCGIDGRMIGANQKYLQLLGYSEAELSSLTIWDITHPDDHRSNAELFQRVLEGEISEFTFEKRYIHKDGHSIWVEAGVTAIRDSDGKPSYWLAVVLDITKRKQAEHALRESEDRYRTLFHSLEEGFCVLEILFDAEEKPVDYRFVETNRTFEKQTGLSNPVGKTARELVPDLDESWFQIYGDVALTGKPARFENEVPAMNRWFDVYAFRIGVPENHQVGLLFSDITSRKHGELNSAFLAEITTDFSQLSTADEIMRAAGEKLARHLQVSSVSFAEVNETEDEATIIFHQRDEKVSNAIGVHRLADFMSEAYLNELKKGHTMAIDDVSTHPLTSALANAYEPFKIASQIHAPNISDGRWKFLLTVQHSAPRQWRQDEIELMADLSNRLWLRLERARSEEALRESEQNLRELSRSLEERVVDRTAELQEKTERLRHLAAELASAEQRERKRLAALLHDELQQLLVAANMQIGILGRRFKNESGAEAIGRAGKWLDEAVNAARDLTRELRPPALYEDGLVAALHWLASEMEKRHSLIVHIDVDGIGRPLNDDIRALLFDCVRELLFNITKYAGVDRATVAVREGDHRLRLVVADEGSGCDVAEVAKNRTSGGFGLFSIRERLAALGGDMTIESAPNRGTRVEMEIPLTETAGRPLTQPVRAFLSAKETQKGERPAITTDCRARVLVVDDHAMVREGIATVLSGDDRLLVVGQAADGIEAIEAVEKHQPEVVLVDVNMPRMNGIEATREIRRRRPETMVIGLSVQDDEATAKSMLDAGAAVFLSKAGNFDAIISAILELVQQGQPSG